MPNDTVGLKLLPIALKENKSYFVQLFMDIKLTLMHLLDTIDYTFRRACGFCDLKFVPDNRNPNLMTEYLSIPRVYYIVCEIV